VGGEAHRLAWAGQRLFRPVGLVRVRGGACLGRAAGPQCQWCVGGGWAASGCDWASAVRDSQSTQAENADRNPGSAGSPV